CEIGRNTSLDEASELRMWVTSWPFVQYCRTNLVRASPSVMSSRRARVSTRIRHSRCGTSSGVPRNASSKFALTKGDDYRGPTSKRALAWRSCDEHTEQGSGGGQSNKAILCLDANARHRAFRRYP